MHPIRNQLEFPGQNLFVLQDCNSQIYEKFIEINIASRRLAHPFLNEYLSILDFNVYDGNMLVLGFKPKWYDEIRF